ncbi:MAG: sialidase family protein, partial [Acidimicrobiales bacterium]
MYANTRGSRGRTDRRGRGPTTSARRALAALAALAVVGAAACSGSSEAASDRANPTFMRASGSAIAYEEPASSVSDLLVPAGEGKPWIVVGSMFDPTSGTTAAATWTAADGRSWERHAVEPAHKGVSEGLSAAVHTDDGDFAVGWVGDGAESDAALWRHDGDEWARSAPEAMAGTHEQWAFDVAAGDGGILVAGGENVWGEVRPRLWFSSDGASWESVDGGPGGAFDAAGGESVRRVSAAGSGFVAVGSVDVDNDQDGAVWYSPDGRSWSRVEAPTLGGAGRQELQSVTWTGKVVVAGGYRTNGNGQGQPFVWRSADGKVWGKPSPALPLYDDSRSAAADYGVTSLSFGAGGITAAGGNDWRPHLWSSADEGKSWKLLPSPVYDTLFADGVSLVDSAAYDRTRVALGGEPNALYLNASGRWQDASAKAFPNGGAQPFATAAVAGKQGTVVAGGRHTAPQGATRETYAGQIWVEADGGWQAVDSKQLAEGRISDIIATKSGYAAVGVEDFGLAAKRQYVGDKLPDGLVWTSPDGRKWTRVGATISKVPDEMLELIEDPTAAAAIPITDLLGSQPPETVGPAGGKGTRSLDAAAPLGNGFIAVGVAYVDGAATPIAVVSPDAKALKGENPGAAGNGNRRFNDVCVYDGAAVAVG